MADLIEHFKKGTFEEQYWLPAHNKRRESSLFRNNKYILKNIIKAPCWVCFTQQELEVHHVFEWAFWEALEKQKITNMLKAISFYDDEYISQAEKPEVLHEMIDELEEDEPVLKSPDDLRNLVVLCKKHHRLKFTGIHSISFPIWLAVAGVPSEGGILTREQILTAVERVQQLDSALSSYASKDYKFL